MPLSWNEIRNRSYAFVNEWKDEFSESAEAKSFLDAFFDVFGVSRRRVASFEHRVKRIDGNDGYIDLLWKGMLLVEQKSRGKNLDRAHSQAAGYFAGLKDAELPKYTIVCDFARFRVYDMDSHGDIVAEFSIEDLPENLSIFGFMAGYESTEVKPEDPVNVEAAEKMGELHDRLQEIGYEGHELRVFLVRLLFCLFAEDTGIFERNLFFDFVNLHTREDGSDLAAELTHLFQVLNKPRDKRLRNLPDQLSSFEYVNGDLFTEQLSVASFDSGMRTMLLEASHLNWAKISPAIFGSLFQSVLDPQARRNLGAHYTSETNILKLIQPLFLDRLYAEFGTTKGNKAALKRFHEKLATLKFLDPACGCGNFLVIAYRELRRLELAVLKELHDGAQSQLDIEHLLLVNVDQFYGIEIEEFPAKIAQVALWLTDHQMNLAVSEEFGQYFSRLPLKTSPTIVNSNALTVDWESVVDPSELSFILGNPPFIGAKHLDDQQRKERNDIFSGTAKTGVLDYVACWYAKAIVYMQKNKIVKTAFVSTNSITQGEQVGILWTYLLNRGAQITFAHRTFEWGSEATKGRAAVHCVIVGFTLGEARNKRIFEYASVRGEPIEVRAKNINPYLLDATNVVVTSRRKPICDVPTIGIGNKPIDNQNYLFSTTERDAFIKEEPSSGQYFHRWLGASEFINNIDRWCLWLGDLPPSELRKMPKVMERVRAVQEFRSASKSIPTQKLADTPTRFHVENMPSETYLLIPRHSSISRNYIPIGFVEPDIFSGDANLIMPGAGLYEFGILSSMMHMVWVRYVCGRLKSDYRYSAGIVYNNYPWPREVPTEKVKSVEAASQQVLDARAMFPDSTLADLYDPASTPASLVKAHRDLDRAVDRCYRTHKFSNERIRMEYLFQEFESQISKML